MNPIINTIGNGDPVVGLVAAMHGNETVGLKIFEKLKNDIQIRKGTLILITANTLALKKNIRYIDDDLNRVFPGKLDGNNEEKLAYQLVKIGKDIAFMVDIHSCSVESPPFCIVRNSSGKDFDFAMETGLQNIVVYERGIQKGGSFIDYVNCGIGIELGLHNKLETFLHGYQAVVNVLGSRGMTEQTSEIAKKYPSIFKIAGHMDKLTAQTQFKTLENFKKVRKGTIIGHDDVSTIQAPFTFYPVLSNEKAYKDNGGWMAVRV